MFVVPMPDLASIDVEGTLLQSMTGKNTPVTDVLLALFKDSDINLVVGETVGGTVTFDIKNTTVEEAFESLMRTLDLDFEFDGDFLRVSTVQRAVFEIDILASSSGGGAGSGGSSGSQSQSESGGNIWESIEADLRSLAPDSQLIVNRVSGLVEIEARPSIVGRVRQYIDHTVRRATQQVSLEARILEVRLDDEFRLGVNWSVLPSMLRWDEIGTLPGGAAFAQTASAGADTLSFGIMKTDRYSVLLQALEEKGQVRVLSSPKVSTMNNIPATIRVVDKIPVIGREVIDSQGGLRTQFDISFVESGVTLRVTPQIGSDGTITVQISPSVIEQTGTVTTPDGLQSEPILSTRDTTTSVRVPNGRAVVLGGLRSTRKGENLIGVPLLQDLPLFGALFRSTVQTREEVELMVIVVPRILDQTWLGEDLRRGAQRLVSLRRPFKISSLRLEHQRPEDWSGGSLQGSARSIRGNGRVVHEDRKTGKAVAAAVRSVTKKGLAGRFIVRGREALGRGKHRSALELFDRALRLDPDRVSVLVTAGVLLARRGDVREARKWLDRAVSLERENVEALTARGVLSMREGRPHAGLKYFQASHEKAKSAWSASNLAAVQSSMGHAETALNILLEAQGGASDFHEFHANLAYAQLKLGMLASAAKSLRRAMEFGADPEDAEIHALRMLIDAAAHDREKRGTKESRRRPAIVRRGEAEAEQVTEKSVPLAK